MDPDLGKCAVVTVAVLAGVGRGVDEVVLGLQTVILSLLGDKLFIDLRLLDLRLLKLGHEVVLERPLPERPAIAYSN